MQGGGERRIVGLLVGGVFFCFFRVFLLHILNVVKRPLGHLFTFSPVAFSECLRSTMDLMFCVCSSVCLISCEDLW